MAACQMAKFLIDDRCQLFEGGAIALAPCTKQHSYVVRSGQGIPHLWFRGIIPIFVILPAAIPRLPSTEAISMKNTYPLIIAGALFQMCAAAQQTPRYTV